MTATRSRRGPNADAYDVAAEIALASLTVVAAVSMQRLFADTSYLRDVVAFALASHLVAAAARRARLSSPAAVLISAACLALTATLLNYRDTTWMMFPTSDTAEALSVDMLDAWELAYAAAAPIEPIPGLVLAAGAALWAIALVADTAAFRTGSAALGVAPAVGVFAFVSAAGVETGWTRQSVLFCAAAAAALTALWMRRLPGLAWIEGRPGRGTLAMARTALATAAVAVVAGAYTGPLLPGSQADPWFDASSLGVENSSTVVLSPLVQVRGRLVSEWDQELFTVEVPRESRQYWRLMSLDEFDSGSWRSRSRFEDAAGRLPSTFDASVTGPSLLQAFSLKSLGGEYLPVAHELRQILDDGGVPMEYEASSGALIRKQRGMSVESSQVSYAVESVLPRVDDPDVLRAVSTSDIEDREFLYFNTDMPIDVWRLLAPEAARVTAGAASDYEKALALQNYFWVDGGFRYDLNVPPSRTTEDLRQFLFDVKAGYCEQFASAYALMARSVDLPARVAVGFTWGDWDEERDLYSVRGEHAHAWPEVYFADIGWVRFEPTPGRGAPDDFAVTGRVADQANFEEEPVVTTTTVASSPSSDSSSTDGSQGSGGGGRSEAGEDTEERSRSATSSGMRWLAWPVAALAAAFVLALSVPAASTVIRRRRRTRFADDHASLVEMSWGDAVQALNLLGMKPKESETPLEAARRMTAIAPGVGTLEDLAVLVTQGRYASAISASAAHEAAAIADTVVRSCREYATPLRRLAAAVNPKRLLV